MLYDLEKLKMIKEELVRNRKTLAVAESVTAGHLQAAFSAAMEAAKFFQGGITAYNAGQKCRLLNVEPIYALEANCVCKEVANTMAIEVNKTFISNYGIGITDYATLQPEMNVNSLYAYYAVANGGDILISKKITTSKEDAVEVQLDYTMQILDSFLTLLKSK
jgi:PncC family amidohydrolase